MRDNVVAQFVQLNFRLSHCQDVKDVSRHRVIGLDRRFNERA